jgi:hypothetical protein
MCLKNLPMDRQAGASKIWDIILFCGFNEVIDSKQVRIAVGFGEVLYLKSMLA